MSWRAEEETSGAMAESEQETMFVWASQTMESARTNEESVSVLRHSTGETPVVPVPADGRLVVPEPTGGTPVVPVTTLRVVAIRLPSVS